jgi:hypothetical protein
MALTLSGTQVGTDDHCWTNIDIFHIAAERYDVKTEKPLRKKHKMNVTTHSPLYIKG